MTGAGIIRNVGIIRGTALYVLGNKVVQKFNIFVKQEVAVLSFVPALNPITELMLMYVHTNLHNKEAIYEFLDAIIFCT